MGDLSMHGQRQRPAGALHLRNHVQSRPQQQQHLCKQAAGAVGLAACHSGNSLSCGDCPNPSSCSALGMPTAQHASCASCL